MELIDWQINWPLRFWGFSWESSRYPLDVYEDYVSEIKDTIITIGPLQMRFWSL